MGNLGINVSVTRSWRAIGALTVCLAVAFGQAGVAYGGTPPVGEATQSAIRTPLFASIVPATIPVENATLVATVNASAWAPPSIDPAGIAYISHLGELLVSDSEVNEEPTVFTGVNMWQVTRSGTVTATGLSPDNPIEPTGLSYDPVSKNIFISNDRGQRLLYIVGAGADGIYGTGDDAVSSVEITQFGVGDPEDVAFDTRTGHLFVADGTGLEIFRIDPGANGVFDGGPPSGDDVITSFDISGKDIEDAEGLGYRASSDTLLIVDAGNNESIFEVTKSGQFLRRIDLDVINIPGSPAETPSDVVIAPASNGSGVDNLYVVDRKNDNGTPDEIPPPFDGTLYELSAPFNNLAPFVDAGSDELVTVSAGASLVGEAYDDGQPSINALTTSWSKASGPGNVTFANPSAQSTTASFDAAGTYVLQLTANDTTSSTVDTVQIFVIPDPVNNKAPVVNAGADQNVGLSSGAVLGASATDDGLPNPPAALTSKWTKVSGPGSVTFSSPASLATSAAFSAPGSYTLRLTVSDSELTGVDDIIVTVAPNPPGPVISTDCVDNEYQGHPFTDLGGFSTEVNDAVKCLGFYGIANGTSATTFSPSQAVTRWQMALFLTRQARAQGIALPTGVDQGFGDIGAYPATVQTAINQLAQLGITKGTAPGVFAPGETVPRWQMALFLSRLIEDVGVVLPDGSSQGYTDISLLPGTTQIAINQITQLNVAKGTGPGAFSPSAAVSRWQMALFLDRTLRVRGLP